jgi:hypothetical protein
MFSSIQLLPDEINISPIQSSSASSHYIDTNWSAKINYTNCYGTKPIKSTGDLRLYPGYGFIVADYYNARIVQTNIYGTYWRTYGKTGSGIGQFNYPFSVHYDNSSGFIFIADTYNHRIVKTRIDGSGWTTYGTWGTGNGSFYTPTSIDYDPSTGFIYVADYNNHRIVRTKINGSGWKTMGTYGEGVNEFRYPMGLDYDVMTGDIYVADTFNGRIVKTDIEGRNWTTCGSEGASESQFFYPGQLSYDCASGFIYVMDRMNHRIVKTKIDGAGWEAYGKMGTSGSPGEFYYPIGIDYDNKTDYLYVTDYLFSRIVRTKMNGSGWKTFGYQSTGTGTGSFFYPLDLSICRSNFVLDGFLESKIIDLGAPFDLLDITFNADIPKNTTIKFQFRTAPNETALKKRNFIGPNGSSKNYYTTSGARLWSGHLGHRWVQYKVYFDTKDPSVSPVLKDVDIHYNLLPKRPVPLTPYENIWINNSKPTFTWKFIDSDSDNQSGFQCQIDDNKKFLNIDIDTTVLSTSQSSFTPKKKLTDGVWYWRVRAKDNDGGWGEFCKTGVFYLDTEKPTSKVVKPVNNSYYKRINIISGTSIDREPCSGLSKVELFVKRLSDNRHWTGETWDFPRTWLTANGTTHWHYNSSNIVWENGETYLIKTRAWDNVSNLELIGKGTFFHYDTEKPESFIDIPADQMSYNKLTHFKGSASDNNGVGVKKVEITFQRASDNYYWSGKYWVPEHTWLEMSGAAEWLYDSSKVLWNSGTKYTITTRANDKLDQVEQSNNAISFNYDLQRPVSMITFPFDESYVNKIYLITGEAVDVGGAGVSSVEILITRNSDNYYWNGKGWDSREIWMKPEIIDETGTWSYDSSNITWTNGKYYNILSRATDNAKNYLTSRPGNTFMFDSEKPISMLSINDKATFTNSTNLSLTLEFEDFDSGVCQMSFSEDGELWTPWEETATVRHFHISAQFDSEKAVFFRVMDRAGNLGQPCMETIIYDSTPPQCSMTFEKRVMYTNEKTVKLNLVAIDTFTGVKDMCFSLNGMDWSAWEPYKPIKDFEFKCTDGRKTIYFKVRDMAGNVEMTSNIIVLDTTPPEYVSISVNANSEVTNNAMINLNLTAFDSLSGVEFMSICTLDQPWTDWEIFQKQSEYELSSGNGQKIIYFRVMDKAGNVAIPASTTIILNEPGAKEYTENNAANSILTNALLIIILVVLFSVFISYLYFRKKRKRKKLAKEQKISVFSVKSQKALKINNEILSTKDTQMLTSTVQPISLQLPQANVVCPQGATTLGKPPTAVVIEHLPVPEAAPQLPPANNVKENINNNSDRSLGTQRCLSLAIPGQVPKDDANQTTIAQQVSEEKKGKAVEPQKKAPMAIPVDMAKHLHLPEPDEPKKKEYEKN